jgi:hypothetical protein
LGDTEVLAGVEACRLLAGERPGIVLLLLRLSLQGLAIQLKLPPWIFLVVVVFLALCVRL